MRYDNAQVARSVPLRCRAGEGCRERATYTFTRIVPTYGEIGRKALITDLCTKHAEAAMVRSTGRRWAEPI